MAAEEELRENAERSLAAGHPDAAAKKYIALSNRLSMMGDSIGAAQARNKAIDARMAGAAKALDTAKASALKAFKERSPTSIKKALDVAKEQFATAEAKYLEIAERQKKRENPAGERTARMRATYVRTLRAKRSLRAAKLFEEQGEYGLAGAQYSAAADDFNDTTDRLMEMGSQKGAVAAHQRFLNAHTETERMLGRELANSARVRMSPEGRAQNELDIKMRLAEVRLAMAQACHKVAKWHVGEENYVDAGVQLSVAGRHSGTAAQHMRECTGPISQRSRQTAHARK